MATPEGKRKAEDGESNGVEGAKRPRLDGGDGAAPAATAAAAPAAKPKPAIDLSVLEKAKKALQLQKELKEKLKKLQMPAPAAGAAATGAVAAAAGAAAAPAAGVPLGAPAAALARLAASAAGVAAPKAPTTKLPPPLVLDEQGREVKPAGAAAAAAPAAAAAAAAAAPAAAEQADRFFDPSIGNRGMARQGRRPRGGLQFVEQGRFQKQAEMARLRAQYGDEHVRQLQERKKQEAALAADKVDVNLIPLGTRVEAPPEEEPQEPIPDVEWWDVRILADKNAMPQIAEGGEVRVRTDRITALVEHPVLIEPPAEAPPPPPQPLKLTKRELKKLRTQRRVAREKEKQELVRQGLLEPPKPKVKISNLMRVLGAEATADPTAVEAEVRRQMAERAAAHEDRNLARKLTPAERRDKKLRKLLGAEQAEGDNVETHVALYKVGDLSRPQLRFKVDVNAKENHLTGAVLVADDFAMVIVEGGQKPLNRYQKLMLRRIDWNQGRDEEEEEGAEGGAPDKPPNYCHLVWQGVVKEPHFKKFKVETVRTEAAARKLLADRGVPHYWDLCAAFTAE